MGSFYQFQKVFHIVRQEELTIVYVYGELLSIFYTKNLQENTRGEPNKKTGKAVCPFA